MGLKWNMFARKSSNCRAPDNFLKQGVADASLEAKGVFLQNPEVFFTPKFLHNGVFNPFHTGNT